MTTKKAPEKSEPAQPVPTTASPASPQPPLVSSYDQLKEAAAQAVPDTKKKG